jgi:hypothetical protein
MGQFKPMVKMMTTEPSVELKLKKGGSATHDRLHKEGAKEGFKPVKKMNGGVMGALSRTPAPTTPMGNLPAARAMAAKRPMRAPALPGRSMAAAPARPMMKSGGMMEALEAHADKPASKAHKGLKTGGVVMGQGGFKDGGIIKSDFHKKTTKMSTAEGEKHFPKHTGEVRMGNDGGYKHGGKAVKKFAKGGGVEGNVSGTPPGVTNTTTGEVKKGNAGGYKKGGAAKKAFATGGVVDTGRPVAMPQGKKPPSKPVAISELSGTFKKGGKVC